MNQQAQAKNTENRTNEDNIRNISNNTEVENSLNDQDNFVSVNRSESDAFFNKSDSDDGFFATDSSDDVMNDALPELSPPKESIEQTRETIMESLVHSFVSITPNNQTSLCESSETTNESKPTNGENAFDTIDVMSVEKDMQILRNITPLRRIPSDSAFPDFQGNTSDLTSVDASEEYATVASASEEPTTVSFFSQSASASQLHMGLEPGPFGRSKSALHFQMNQQYDKDESHPVSARPACDTTDHWLLNDDWLRKDSYQFQQNLQKVDPNLEKSKPLSGVGLEAKSYSDSTQHQTTLDSRASHVNSQQNPEAKPEARDSFGKSSFKATKLPRFYRLRSNARMTSSRSESCIISKESRISSENVTAKRSQSSNSKFSRLPMIRSKTNETLNKKDAGGVSYAVRHSVSPKRTSAKQCGVLHKVKPPLATRSPDRKKSTGPHEPIKEAASGSSSKPGSKPTLENNDFHKQRERTKAFLNTSGAHSLKSVSVERVRNANKNESKADRWQRTDTDHPSTNGPNLSQRVLPSSPKKVTRQTAATLNTFKSHLDQCDIRQNNDGAATPKRTASSSSKVSLKRPTPLLRGKTSSIPVTLGQTDAETAALAAPEQLDRSGVGTGAVWRRSTDTAPTLMSVKVDVSVRSKDGLLHGSRDMSPPQDGKTGDLFSGVEQFIRSLLENPSAGGGPLAASPPSAALPQGGTSQSPVGCTDVSAVERGLVSGIRPTVVPSVTPRGRREAGGEVSDGHGLDAPDSSAQRLQAEGSVLLLTSTGSISSTDLWPEAARRIVYPSTTTPFISVAAKRLQPRKQPPIICTATDQSAENKNDGEKGGSNPEWQKHGNQSNPDAFSTLSAVSEPCPGHNSISSERALPPAPPCSPVRRKSAPSSPERGQTPSPRSRIPVPVKMVSVGVVPVSRSPTPERRSFYHTAATTPQRPRSVTPDSLRSATGSSASLHSLKRSPRAAELRKFGSLSPLRASPPISEKSNDGRSRSASPCSARSSPRRHSCLGQLRGSPQHNQTPNRCSPIGVVNETLVGSSKNTDGDILLPKRDPDGEIPSQQCMEPASVRTKLAEVSSTDIEPVTSSSREQSQDSSSGEYAKIRHTHVPSSETLVPTPLKRSMTFPFGNQPVPSVQRPIPQKRKNNVLPVRPDTTHPQNEELMISSKTSFCSMDSPVRNTSPSPYAALPLEPTSKNTGITSDHQNSAEMKIGCINTSLKQEPLEENVKQSSLETPSPRTPAPRKLNSPAPENGSSMSLSYSASPNSAQSDRSDHVQDVTKPNGQEHQWQHQRLEQNVNKDITVASTTLEREMIETENTLRLMEETICVLERQNNSLALNTKQISDKICQERSRRCDIKTAKLMLQKVRMELQKTTKKSEENRMQLVNANDKISEQESAIFLLKESLREECIKNVRMERCIRQRSLNSGGVNVFQHMSQLSEVNQREQAAPSVLSEPSSVRELLEETETLLQQERKTRKDVEDKLVHERSQKFRILNAAKKWRQQLETGTKPVGLGDKVSNWESKIVLFPGVSDSESSNVIGYRNIHTSGNTNNSIKIDPMKSKSDESILGGHKFDNESSSSSEYFLSDLTEKQDGACQCDILDRSPNTTDNHVEMQEINEMTIDDAQRDRIQLQSELHLTNLKLKEETQKKELFEHELKNLIERIHEMQRDVQLYKKQSNEQLATIRQTDHERIENFEMEKLKLKDYYQQQMEAVVQEKVSEFQGKVGHLETVVREQINSYTKSMQQKFREKLATASLQQKEVISRLEAEHSKEVERLTAEYPQEIERLRQRLSECRQEVIAKKNKLERRETQVGTILRVVKLLIREGNAMKGDTKEQNSLEIARKILRCMDLNPDDIVSPRPHLSNYTHQEVDGEHVTKDGSCATFRSIPDSPRPKPASRTSQIKRETPVPSRRRTLSNASGQKATLTHSNSDDSTSSQPFNVPGEVKKTISYTRFGDEVIRARSNESIQKNAKAQTKQLSTMSDLSQWGESGSWVLNGVPPVAPPPTPPSVTTSTGINTDGPDLVSKESAQDVASSVLNEFNRPVRVKTVADKGTGSATSLIRDPSFLLLSNSILVENVAQMCQCQRLQRAIDEYGKLRMTIAHRRRLKERPSGRERTRSSSETSINRLASSYFEAFEGGGNSEAKKLGLSKMNISDLTNSEQQSSKAQVDGSRSVSKVSSDSNQLFNMELKKTLSAKVTETGGKFSNPFSLKPIQACRTNSSSEKVTSKPPIQNAIVPSPSRAVPGRSPSPSRREKTSGVAEGTAPAQPELARSRLRQDAAGLSGRTTSPSRNATGMASKTSSTLKRMPSFDKVDVFDSKESSEDSKFALPQPPPPLELKPRDNRTSVQRKQLAALRKQSPREKEKRHSISPRERKLFMLRSQQHAEKKITRTEVTKRALSPAPISPHACSPTAAALNQTRNLLPTFKRQRDRSRSRRRSASSSMDWKKYIKTGQPWQDVYLHEHRDPNYVEPIPANGTFHTAEMRGDDPDRSDWSPSYSWAPPRPGERDKWNRYLTSGHPAEQIALERFYATPERESAGARRRKRCSRKQAEVLEYISRMLAASSGSDPSQERIGGRAERGTRRVRSHQRRAADPAWAAPTEHQRDRNAVLDDVRRKALGQLGERHPADPLADLSAHRSPPDQGGRRPLQQQRVSHSLDRELPMPHRDCSVHQRLSSDVKTHQRLAREHSRQRRHSIARDRSVQQRWPAETLTKMPLMVVSRTPRGELAPPERRHHRSHSYSRHGTAASALDNLDMDLWVDRWERRWDQERKQRSLMHSPST